jgi:hypothetical protein
VVSAPRTCRSELFLVSTAGEENPARVARLCLFLARVSRSSHGFDFRAASCCPVSVLGCVRSGLVRKQEAAATCLVLCAARLSVRGSPVVSRFYSR